MQINNNPTKEETDTYLRKVWLKSLKVDDTVALEIPSYDYFSYVMLKITDIDKDGISVGVCATLDKDGYVSGMRVVPYVYAMKQMRKNKLVDEIKNYNLRDLSVEKLEYIAKIMNKDYEIEDDCGDELKAAECDEA